MSLGKTASDRQKNYCQLFARHVEGELLKEIRTDTQAGMAIGNNRFKEELDALTGRRLKSKKLGRPVGWRKERKQFYSDPFYALKLRRLQ